MYKLLVLCVALLFSVADNVYADDSIPLDKQIKINLPEKLDKEYVKFKKEQSKKKISYEGVWQVKNLSGNCQSELLDFKIRVSGQEIDTIVGMSVLGAVNNSGTFEMKSGTKYWSIRFNGLLKSKSGEGQWVRTDIKKKTLCKGTMSLVRLGS